MDTYGVAEAVDASVPDMFDQFFRADDTILVKHKIFQQSGFLRVRESSSLSMAAFLVRVSKVMRPHFRQIFS